MIPGWDRLAPSEPDTDRMTSKDDIHDRAARVAGLALTKLSRPQPQEKHAMAGNFFVGSDGRRRDFDSSGRELGSQGGTTAGPASLASPLAASIQRPDAQSTKADTRTSYGAPSLARPQPGQQQPTMSLTRPVANPVAAATGIPFDEAVRRAENAGMDARRMARSSKGMYTRAQLEAAGAEAAAGRNFWLDQAKSIPGAAQRMAEYQAEQGSAERIAGTEAAAAMQRAQAENDARLQGIRMQERGAMDRVNAEGQFNLRRPQRPVTLADGSLAAPGPDGTLQPYTLPDGSPAQAMLERPQINQGALGRLTTDLMPQFLGTDSYGMVPDADAEDGVRYPTQEERLAAFRQASSAARETLSGSTAADPQRQQQAPARPTSARPTSQDEFLERARTANPGYSDEELIAFYTQNYGSR